jgi:hypothetical protein
MAYEEYEEYAEPEEFEEEASEAIESLSDEEYEMMEDVVDKLEASEELSVEEMGRFRGLLGSLFPRGRGRTRITVGSRVYMCLSHSRIGHLTKRILERGWYYGDYADRLTRTRLPWPRLGI